MSTERSTVGSSHNLANHLIAGVHFYSFWYCLALIASLPARAKIHCGSLPAGQP